MDRVLRSGGRNIGCVCLIGDWIGLVVAEVLGLGLGLGRGRRDLFEGLGGKSDCSMI